MGTLRLRERLGLSQGHPNQGGFQPGILHTWEEELGKGEWAPSYETFLAPSSHPGLTLGLHTGPDQGQGVTGYLATGAGDGAAGQEHEDARVSRVMAVLLEPLVLQGLAGVKRGTGWAGGGRHQDPSFRHLASVSHDG